MTQDEARGILEMHVSKSRYVTLPIVDEVIYSTGSFQEGTLEDWTFLGLIKIAYDL